MLRTAAHVVLLSIFGGEVAAARDAAPTVVARRCEQQAQAQAGAPAASPRSQPDAAVPSDDVLPRRRANAPAPTRGTPGPTQQDVEAANTPRMPSTEPRDAYRSAYEACLRARGY
jgi:hypothetical protein